jgi:Holliday junction resolvase RusA-like endonuclease
LKLTLPYPPSSNRYWRMDKRGFNYVSAEARKYKTAVHEIAALAGVVPLEGAVSLQVDVYRPQRSGDLDNRLKICLDCCQGLLFVNDNQVVKIVMRRFEDKTNPRLEISVSEVKA